MHRTAEAMRRGYRAGDPEWCNLGQGQPETGDLPGAPPRIGSVTIDVNDLDTLPHLAQQAALVYPQMALHQHIETTIITTTPASAISPGTT